MSRRILVIIPYDITIGFAFSRLIGVFFDACVQATENPDDVHFAFSAVGAQYSAALPSGFSNLVEFNSRAHQANDVQRLCDYIRRHRIEAAFIVDVAVEAGYLRDIRNAGIKTIIAYWGAPLSRINRGWKLLLKRLEVKYLRPAKPDHFIVESQAMLDTAVQGRGIPISMMTIVPTGVDEAKFRPLLECQKHVYTKFDIPPHRSVVVFMGHLHKRKGVHILLQAADHIVKQLHRKDMHFLFLGNRQGEVDAFDGVYDPLVTGPFITFGGYQADVPELLAGCRVGCVPTTGWDSFPLSPLEMQACGLPVVVSDCQGLPESVIDGVTGLVVPAGDVTALSSALQRIIDNNEMRRTMSAAAVKRIRSSFTRSRQVDGIHEVVRRMTGWREMSPVPSTV
ncbi:MAG: glycosyltransferase family 4 protein [Nitrospira sp.]|nr:glycosyltransferase family 4 protein [Nitrospira sp.]MCP9462678.1 glycosyltransferase family 4 protein [Nitrospira sp.]MCP9476107.1 glycosyltransferase family 4 protein [Nitrospira sp.]